MESCDGCGFIWESVARDEISSRITGGIERIAQTMKENGDDAGRRPAPDRWSMVEYAAHVRDVLLHVRDRFVIGLVEDNPSFKPLYRDERVNLGLYGDDDATVVQRDLAVAADLFNRTFDRINALQLERSVQYAFPTLSTRTLLWMGQQVVHEVEHHAGDIADNANG